MGLKGKYHVFHVVESTHHGRPAPDRETTNAASPRPGGEAVMVAVPLCGVKTHDGRIVGAQRRSGLSRVGCNARWERGRGEGRLV